MRKGTAPLLIFLLSCSLFAEGFFSFDGGLVVPSMVSSLDNFSDRSMWRLGLNWGGLSDETGVGAGGRFDISWQRNTRGTRFDTLHSDYAGSISLYDIDREVRRTRLTVGPYIAIDPLYHLAVHPAFKIGFAPGMLIYTNREYVEEEADDVLTEHSGVYWGAIGFAGFDVHATINGGFSLYAGFEYQWGSMVKRKWGTATRYRQEMHGPSFSIGMRFL